jgi:5-methylcytosine-specific restriction enzyme A
MTDPFYKSGIWKQLRAAALKRDHYTCVVPGCGRRAVVVDHVKRRRDGGADALSNLRSLCDMHDRQLKERPGGKRGNRGTPYIKGCDARGRPLDPNHPWNRK